VLAIAFAEGEAVVWEHNDAHTFRHVEELFVCIQRGLQELSWNMNDLDCIVCGLGPGSFTGLRVGLAAVKGFSLAHVIRIVGVSSLDVIAQNAASDTDCTVLLDARREKLYAAHFCCQTGKHGEDALVSYEELVSVLQKKKTTVTLCGDGLQSYGERLAKDCSREMIILPEKLWYPRGASIITCGQRAIERQEFLNESACGIVPRYFRRSIPEEIKAEKKNKK